MRLWLDLCLNGGPDPATLISILNKLSMADKFLLPIPGYTNIESKVLRILLLWTDLYNTDFEKNNKRKKYTFPPTTDKCAKYFNVSQESMLAILNRLEGRGLVRKARRNSAGPSGYGYNGSLFSSVFATDEARKIISKFYSSLQSAN